MSRYPIAREIRPIALRIPFCRPLVALSYPILRIGYAVTPIRRGVRYRRRTAGKLPLAIYEPQGIAPDAPILLYFHGGSFSYLANPHHRVSACRYALGANCRVICPDYRLAPKPPAPAAREDAKTAYDFVKETYPGARIAVGGDSAGGAIAACLAAERQVCFQMLIYPVCDASCSTRSATVFTDTPLWDAVGNRKMWKWYLSGGSPVYAAPMQTPLPGSPAPAYIEVTEFDPLHDEGIAFARRLRDGGAKVELNETLGTFHAYDAVNCPLSRSAFSQRIAALKAAFSD